MKRSCALRETAIDRSWEAVRHTSLRLQVFGVPDSPDRVVWRVISHCTLTCVLFSPMATTGVDEAKEQANGKYNDLSDWGALCYERLRALLAVCCTEEIRNKSEAV